MNILVKVCTKDAELISIKYCKINNDLKVLK